MDTHLRIILSLYFPHAGLQFQPADMRTAEDCPLLSSLFCDTSRDMPVERWKTYIGLIGTGTAGDPLK